ncbi:MAG: transcriptional repressor [Desulfobacterales bacterium]|nr:transcriptional repressor [Desulfobacterales bacterium]
MHGIIYEHHCHLRCLNCGKIIEFEEKSLKKVEKGLAEKDHFLVKGHKFEVVGYCPKCKAHI